MFFSDSFYDAVSMDVIARPGLSIFVVIRAISLSTFARDLFNKGIFWPHWMPSRVQYMARRDGFSAVDRLGNKVFKILVI